MLLLCFRLYSVYVYLVFGEYGSTSVLGMQRTAFAVTFRDVVGQTPADYLSDWRVALAQTRLRAGQPVKAMAEELGYAHPSALSRAFGARVGMSPRQWLAQVSAGDAPR